tara:strand:+ start:5161 stop:5559 length:399 start_codon:yes stop_codon:yes gene_type:complete
MESKVVEEQTKGRILVVDDDPDMVRGLTRILRKRGYEIGQAYGGLEAVESVRRFCPNIVLMDIRMPDLNGIEAYTRMKQFHPELMAILMSGSCDLLPQAQKSGAYLVLQKPLNPERLFEALQPKVQSAQAVT